MCMTIDTYICLVLSVYDHKYVWLAYVWLIFPLSGTASRGTKFLLIPKSNKIIVYTISGGLMKSLFSVINYKFEEIIALELVSGK